MGGTPIPNPAPPGHADTTRPPRKGEADGAEYHFVSAEEMARGIAANEFLEFGSFRGDMFGTRLDAVRRIHECGQVAVLDIEPQVGGGRLMRGAVGGQGSGLGVEGSGKGQEFRVLGHG